MSKQWTAVEEMNPVAMTIMNPRKEYWTIPRIEPATSFSQVQYQIDRATGLSTVENFRLGHIDSICRYQINLD